MNYRHAFHAGNFADVFKHALLTRMLLYLTRKDAPLRFIDTHAGIGRYDLASPQAQRSGEWRDGIARLLSAAPPAPAAALLGPYCDLARAQGDQAYPGSPLVAAALLRPADRLMLCELHAEDARTLRRVAAADKRIKVVPIDGYQGLNAFTPPPERRGLVLIDPPYEARDEWTRMLAALCAAYAKWPTGVYVLWHPLKDRGAVAWLHGEVARAGIRRVLALELETGPSADGRMTGCGLLVVNPTHGLDGEARVLLPALASILATGPAPDYRIDWLVGE